MHWQQTVSQSITICLTSTTAEAAESSIQMFDAIFERSRQELVRGIQ